MSQPSSQALDPSWVSVSFAKFSHNSSPFGTRVFTWNHIASRSDLDFVLRNIRLVDENGNFHNRIIMKINAGAEELEQQDLYELTEHIQTFGSSSGAEMPVQVVVKSPFLAMRYPKSANLVRRIQLKFHSDADFTKVLNFLRDLSFPITGAGAASAIPSISQPSISPAPSLLSDKSSSTLSPVSFASTRLSLPTSSLSSYPVIRAANEQLSSPSDPLTSKFKVPMRPNSSFSETPKHINSLHLAVSQLPRPATSSNCFPLNSLNLSQTLMQTPTSLYVKQLEREVLGVDRNNPLETDCWQSESRRQSCPLVKSSQEDPRPNLPLHQSQIDSQSRSGSDLLQYPSLQLSQSPFFAPQKLSPDLSPSVTQDLNSSNADRDRPQSETVERRNTALFEATEENRLSIPPKRKLPFPKPREALPRSASVSNLSAMPKPPPVSHPQSAHLGIENEATKQFKEQIAEQDAKPVLKITKKRVAQRKSTTVKPAEVVESPLPEDQSKADASAFVAPPQYELSPLATKSFAAASGLTSTTGLQSKATVPKKRAAPNRPSPVLKRPKMVDQSTQTETGPSPNPEKAPYSSRKQETSGSVIAHRAYPMASAPEPLQESYLDAIDTFVGVHRSRPKPKELWEQPGWAEADEEERQGILSNFICENLENKDFIQLCEDTMASWRRIGLGL